MEPFDWDYSHVRLRFFPVVCRLESADEPALAPGGRAWRWVAPNELADFEFPPANTSLIAELATLSIDN